MASKKGSRSSTADAGPAIRAIRLAPGKRATIETKPGYDACLVLAPVQVSARGEPVMGITLRIAAGAGKVTFTPRGKDTIVIDGPAGMRPTDPRIKKLVSAAMAGKGGNPPPVKNFT